MPQRLLLIIGFLLVWVSARGVEARQTALPDQDEVLDIRRWSTFTEVSSRGVRSVATAPDTTVWFGTEDGLLHYDGLTWTTIEATEPWQTAPVDVLLALDDGRLVTGSEWGLGVVEDGVWRTVAESQSRPVPIDGLAQAPDKSIWAATAWGAMHVDGTEVVLYTSREMEAVLSSQSMDWRVEVVPDSAVPERGWSAGLGLKIVQGAWFGLPRERSPVSIWAVKPGGPADRAGILPGDMLGRVDGQASITRNRLKRPSETPVHLSIIRGADSLEVSLSSEPLSGFVRDFHLSDIAVAEDGTVWMAPYEGDVVRFAPGESDSWRRFSLKDGVGPGWSPRITAASDGSVWLVSGASETGVLRFDGQSWRETRLSLLGATDANTDILETADGTIWVGGANLSSFRDGAWKVYPPELIPASDHRTQLAASDDGSLWVVGPGEWASRLDRLSDRWAEHRGLVYQGETQTERWFLTADGQAVSETSGVFTVHPRVISEITSLLISPEGLVWGGGVDGGSSGIAGFDGSTWRAMAHPRIEKLVETGSLLDASGYAWFGSSSGPSGGILRLDTERLEWRRYLHPAAPPFVYGIAQTEDGTIWTGGHQLYRKDTNWSAISAPTPVSSFVTDVAAGQDNSLWVTSRFYGVLRQTDGAWQRFAVSDGLPASRAEAIVTLPGGDALVATPAGLARFDGNAWTPVLQGTFRGREVMRGGLRVAPDGSLWINATDPETGVVAIRYRPDSVPPETRFDNISDRVPWGRPLTMLWSGVDEWNDTPGEQLAFSYRVNEGPWSAYSISRATVVDFDDWGDHSLAVRARDGDFNVDPEPAVHAVSVLPPLWARARVVFPGAVLLGLIALLVGRLARRKNELDEINEALEAQNTAIAASERLQGLLLDITARLLVTDPEEVDEFVNFSLEKLGRLAGSDAAYLFRFTRDSGAFYNTHNWSSGNLRVVAFRERPMPAKLAKWHIDRFLNGEPVVLSSLDDLPVSALAERRWIEIQQISSMVNVPIVSLNKVVGFIGMATQAAERVWTQEEVAVLGVAGQLITSALDGKMARLKLETLSQSLELANADLETRVRERTGELSAANHQLEARIRQGKELEVALLDATDRERRRLGADLHDGIAQSVAGARMLAASIVGQPGAVDSVLASIDEMLSHTQGEIGKLMAGYGLVGSDYSELGSALNTLVQDLSSRYPAIVFDCLLQPETRSLSWEAYDGTHLLRIAAEACTNAIKHGAPSTIKVSLKLEGEQLVLQVTDNGTGLEGTDTEGWGYGMRIMQYRASRVGANLVVSDHPNGGVQVTCTVPIPSEAAAFAG